jgi:hypothetical protein
MREEPELNDVQFDILDSVYFVESLEHILEETDTPRAVVIDELRTMIDRGWVQVMQYDEAAGDYVRTSIYDADNMDEFCYLATKQGLLRHNGR